MGLKGAVQSVTTAGTRVQLPAYSGSEVMIMAKEENTGAIFIGGEDVSSAVYGAKLNARDSITLKVSNANMIYIDAETSDEGVSYFVI